MFMYASCEHNPTRLYDCEGTNTNVGDDLPMDAINEFSKSPLCVDSLKNSYAVSGPSLVALTSGDISNDDIWCIGDMMSVSAGMNSLVANWLLSRENKGLNPYILEYVAICTKYGLRIGKILVPKHSKLVAPKNILKT